MKKILYCFGIGLLIINSIIAAGTTFNNYEPDVTYSDIIETKGDQSLPIIGEFHLIIDWDGTKTMELVGMSSEINWTTTLLTVKILVSVTNPYNYNGSTSVRYRIAEWKNQPLQNIIFFLTQGNIATRQNESEDNVTTKDNRPGWGILFGMNSLPVNYKAKTNYTNEVLVDIEFKEAHGTYDVAMYMCDKFPLGHLHSDYGSVKVHF